MPRKTSSPTPAAAAPPITPTVGVLVHEEKVLGKGLEALRSALADAGVADPPWRQVDKSKKAAKQVRKLLDDGVERLLVWGGDGTVRRCVDTIVTERAHVEVGILPAGTANLFAKAMGVPIDVRGAVDTALHGIARPIDVGMINGEAFCVMAGTGFDALMIRDAEDGLKDRLGSLAYVRTALSNLDSSGAAAEVLVDGETWFSGRAACVLVGNTGRILGGVDAFPDARPDDGLLDVGVVTAQGRADWVRVGARVLTGGIDASPFVEMTQASTVEIRLDRTLPWELDGGDRDREKRFEVTVLARRIPICVPVPS